MFRLYCLLFLLISGCATLPPTQQATNTKPKLPASAPEPFHAPEHWKNSAASNTTESTASHQNDWWLAYGDASLNTLIDEALRSNPDILTANARVEHIQSLTPTADPDDQPLINASEMAAENNVKVIRQSVAHAVTLTYLEAHRYVEQSTLNLQQGELLNALSEIEKRRLAAGLSTAQATAAIEERWLSNHRMQTQLRHQQSQAELKLATLLGKPAVEFTLTYPPTEVKLPKETPIIPPGELVAQRPDIQAAWQQLQAATLDTDSDLPIGVAVEQVSISERNALYRRSALIALQEVETTISQWKSAHAALVFATDTVAQKNQQNDTAIRLMEAGRANRAEVIQQHLAVNQAQQVQLDARYDALIAYASLMLALGKGD